VETARRLWNKKPTNKETLLFMTLYLLERMPDPTIPSLGWLLAQGQDQK